MDRIYKSFYDVIISFQKYVDSTDPKNEDSIKRTNNYLKWIDKKNKDCL